MAKNWRNLSKFAPKINKLRAMIKKLLSFFVMASAMFTLTSCLGDSDDDNVTYYDDTAATAFTLGTLNRYLHTTASDGVTDSVYKKTYSASTYKFYIDQQQKLIYNTDSLLYGTDPSKVICSISTLSSGTAVWAYTNTSGSDSLVYYSSTDSIDFTTPRKLRVYNMRGTAYREYTVSVNVHQQTGDELSWSSTSYSNLSQVAERKIVNNNGTLYLFGNVSGATIGFKKNGASWTQLSGSLSQDAYKSMVVKNGTFYTLSNGSVMSSTDGTSWSTVATVSGLTQFIGASNANLYALTGSGISHSADGITWTADELDSDASNLPTDNVNFICTASVTNDSTNNIIIVGTANGATKRWKKTEENATNSQSQAWSYYEEDEYNTKNALPALDNMQVIGYNNGLLALGGDFSTFYFSKDQGLTWTANALYKLGDDFGKSASAFTMACDSDAVIYITKASSTLVWSGQLARAGWKTEQKSYTK